MNTANADVRVRPMQPEDTSRIAALERICFSSPWSEKSLDESLHRSEYTFLVAELDGVTAGYAGMIRALDEAEITDVAVFPAYRQRGAASALMMALVENARASGISRIFLEVRESNAAALALYEKAGFARVGLRKNFYDAPREHAVLMVCETGL